MMARLLAVLLTENMLNKRSVIAVSRVFSIQHLLNVQIKVDNIITIVEGT